jgi:hypothetical protein
MSLVLVTVLAQVVNLGLQDRTEARRVVLNDQRFEAETTPAATLTALWPRREVKLTYGASLLETPLESPSRKLLVYHTIAGGASQRFKKTTVSFTSRTSFGELNFWVAALGSPAIDSPSPVTPTPEAPAPSTPTPTPTPSTPGVPVGPTPQQPTGPTAGVPQTRVVNRAVNYLTSTTTAAATRSMTKELTLGASASYTIAGGLDEEARRDYPMIRGTTLGFQGAHVRRWSATDTSVLDATGQSTWSSNGNVVTALLATETWRHAFSEETNGFIGAGLSVIRFSRFDGLVAYSIFPTFQVGFAHNVNVARGKLNVQVAAFSAPALDPLRATIDPRLGGVITSGWAGRRFLASLTLNATSSVAPAANNSGSFDSLRGTLLMGYRLGDMVVVDTGARVAQQTFQSTTLIPITYTVFTGVNVAYERRLNGSN